MRFKYEGRSNSSYPDTFNYAYYEIRLSYALGPAFLQSSDSVVEELLFDAL